MNLFSELRESEMNKFEKTREILEACKNPLVNMSDNEKTAEINFKHRIMIDLSVWMRFVLFGLSFAVKVKTIFFFM